MADHIIGKAGVNGVPYEALINAIRKEGDELSRRIGAISQFIETPGFQILDILDKHMITLQREIMQSYVHLLTMRLARFDDARRGVLPATAAALGKKPLIQ